MKLGRPLRTIFGAGNSENCRDEAYSRPSVSCKTTLNDDQMLACLSRRIPIDFVDALDVPSEQRGQIFEAENRQVEYHMRLCLKIDSFMPKGFTLPTLIIWFE